MELFLRVLQFVSVVGVIFVGVWFLLKKYDQKMWEKVSKKLDELLGKNKG